MSKFEEGDIVQLKSGGPAMTVCQVLGVDNYRCQWFSGKKLETGDFPYEALVVPSADEDATRKK